MNKKYDFMNILRVLSFFSIVFYHMLITLYIYGIRQIESIRYFFENSNMHIAKVGVSLFFILSGAGLMLGSKDKEIDVKQFYLKRFKKILIPFYITYICYFIFLVASKQVLLSDPYEGRNLKPYSFIFTLFGMDAYWDQFGIPTCSFGIGEWFLGCLILIYLIYPILRALMQKNKYLTLLGATIYYIFMNIIYSKIAFFHGVPMYTNLTIKIYDFILGMFLALILDSIPKYAIYPALIISIFFILCPVTLPGVDSFQIPIHSICAFIIFAHFEKTFQKHGKITKVFDLLAAYSYEYFLIHHFVILELSKFGRDTEFGNFKLMILFICEILLTAVLAIILKKIISLLFSISNAESKKRLSR